MTAPALFLAIRPVCSARRNDDRLAPQLLRINLFACLLAVAI